MTDNELVDKVSEKMQERGYSLHSLTHNGTGELTCINYSYIDLSEENKAKRFPVPTYCVRVYPREEEFECIYTETHSLNRLMVGKCGSFYNDEHFDRIVMKFEKSISILAKYDV